MYSSSVVCWKVPVFARDLPPQADGAGCFDGLTTVYQVTVHPVPENSNVKIRCVILCRGHAVE
jgi:hypothetical protein